MASTVLYLPPRPGTCHQCKDPGTLVLPLFPTNRVLCQTCWYYACLDMRLWLHDDQHSS